MFISLEGTEGVGKSTLIQSLQHYFEQQGRTVVLTREPGGTPLAEKIRALLLEKNDEQVDESAELLLMYAARCQHIRHTIQPALDAGQVVISDRFFDASFAYQCAGRGLSEHTLTLLNEHFIQLRPNITFWLDAPIEMGMARAKNRGQLDRFEQESLQFFSRVRAGYEQLYQREPQRIVRLDATQSAADVFAQAVQVLESKI
ncbi:MAG: dTMP kinase [Acinetobacter sp.]|nr:dTMP kinase [Acinetobacter sp.]